MTTLLQNAKRLFLSFLLMSMVLATNTVTFASKNAFTLPSIKNMQTLHKKGRGTFKKFGFTIFHAQYWASNQQNTEQLTTPYVLQLKYARKISAKRIVSASISEMKKHQVSQQNLNRWQAELKRIIPNVTKGDVITGINHGGYSSFYLNNKLLGQIKKPDFGTDFFGIWLNASSSDKDLRKQLLELK